MVTRSPLYDYQTRVRVCSGCLILQKPLPAIDSNPEILPVNPQFVRNPASLLVDEIAAFSDF